MNFIIIGDRFQKRMKSKGCVGLITINNKTIFDIQYKYIKKYFPLTKITYISGFDHKRFIAHIHKNSHKYQDLNIVYNNKYNEYNYGHSLSLIKDYLTQDTIISFGDVVFNNNTFKKFHQNFGSQIFLTSDKTELGCIITDNKIPHIAYDLNNYLSNIYYLSNNDSLNMKNLFDIKDNKYRNFFIFELINILIDKTSNFKPFFIG
jgi:CTP:phosphocholine cytidylyltransferase-like protein